MKRRIESLLLALAMVLTLLPVEALPVWADDPVEYTVTFATNGGGTIQPQTVTAGQTATRPADPVKTGVTFDGWYTDSAFSAETKYDFTAPVTKDLTLYAKWTATVTFNANGGTGTMAPMTVTAGTSVRLTANTFQRDGYLFLRWNTKTDGSGTNYINQKQVTLSENITLYAQWGKSELTVTFHANAEGATGTMEPQIVERNQGTRLIANAFKLEGYDFASWNTQPAGDGEMVVDEKIVTLTEDMDLYAQWTKSKYKIHYDANAQGVTGMPTRDGEKLPGAAVTLSVARPEREDYVFLGWSADKNATEAEYQPGGTLELDTIAENGVITLYAVWGKKDVLVTFSSNGGYGSMSAQSFKNGVADNIKPNDFARMGRTFKYWNTEADGSGTDYEDKALATFTESLTLYAIWDPSVVYRANNGTADKFVQSVALGASTVMKENVFTRKGYNFKCWNTKADGSGTNYQVKEGVSLSENTDLYAVWSPYSYTVRFHANGGVGTMEDQRFEYGKAQALTANVYTRTGRTFKGWSLTPGGEVKYKDKESVKDVTDVDNKTVLLYAVWDTSFKSDTAAEGSIWIQQGSRVIKSMTPKDGDPYSFEVEAGIYNVVVTSGDRRKTVMVTTDGGTIKGSSILSPESANSVLELKAGAPDVVVGNLERAAEDNRVTGSATELKLTVARAEENGGEAFSAIRERCPEGKSLEFLDLTLTKSVGGKEDDSFSGECSENLILRIPFTKAATKDITVFRWHDGTVTELTTRKQAEEYIEVENDAVMIYARRFSTFAICYTSRQPAISYSNCPRNYVCPIQPFDDANPSSWYHDGVHWALENGAMQGVTARRFYPNEATTRAQLVTILWRMEGSPTGYYAYFDDVAINAWYAGAVGWAASRGIVTGRSTESFDPNGTLTREQLATILYRYVQLKTGIRGVETVGLGAFSDAGSVSSWAREGMDWLTSYGVLDGMTTADGVRLLAPKTNATRAQVATVMMRCWEGFLN